MTNLQTAVDIAARSSASARNDAITETRQLMAQHLHREHGLGPYAIARRLGLKVKDVEAYLGGVR